MISGDSYLCIDAVSRVFNSGQKDEFCAVRDVSLEVGAREFVSIIGPSGCGKSTLLRMIAGLDSPTCGSIYVEGVLVEGTDYRRGFVFQESILYPWMDVWHNVAAGLTARGVLKGNEDHVDAYVEKVGLSKFAKSYPRELSGGMAQRTALARSLVNEPEILLLDEPFGALDALTRITMQDEILRLWDDRRITMILVTHDIDEAVYLGDHVVVMSPSPGSVVEVLPIDLDRPRKRDAPDFIAYRNKLLSLIFGDASAQPSA